MYVCIYIYIYIYVYIYIYTHIHGALRRRHRRLARLQRETCGREGGGATPDLPAKINYPC